MSPWPGLLLFLIGASLLGGAVAFLATHPGALFLLILAL